MNKVVHFEVPFDDKERVNKFYSETFGWKLTDFPAMKYMSAATVETDEKMMPKEAGAINGGMFKRGSIEGAPNGPTIVLEVDSVDEYIKKVEAAGGEKATEKVAIGDMGFYAYVKDTEGNIIGLWENAKK